MGQWRNWAYRIAKLCQRSSQFEGWSCCLHEFWHVGLSELHTWGMATVANTHVRSGVQWHFISKPWHSWCLCNSYQSFQNLFYRQQQRLCFSSYGCREWFCALCRGRLNLKFLFIGQAGIASGGLQTGAGGLKTEKERSEFGGLANVPFGQWKP